MPRIALPNSLTHRLIHRTFRPLAWARVHVLCGLLAVLMLTGCTSWTSVQVSDLAIQSQADASLAVEGNFEQAVYGMLDRDTLTIVLIDGPIESPRQAVTIRMFWKPKAGKTPISPAATNATVHYMVFTDDASSPEGGVAIYSGAGYLFPRDEPGEVSFAASLWDSTVLLKDQSQAYEDLLGPARISGNFTATLNDTEMNQLLNHLNRIVAERLGYPRLVNEPTTTESEAAMNPS